MQLRYVASLHASHHELHLPFAPLLDPFALLVVGDDGPLPRWICRVNYYRLFGDHSYQLVDQMILRPLLLVLLLKAPLAAGLR